jgi:hypothetical protein
LKVKVVNEQGAEVSIDTGSIKVGAITLDALLKKVVTLENQLLVLNRQLSSKEAKLQQMVKKL